MHNTVEIAPEHHNTTSMIKTRPAIWDPVPKLPNLPGEQNRATEHMGRPCALPSVPHAAAVLTGQTVWRAQLGAATATPGQLTASADLPREPAGRPPAPDAR